MADPVVTEDAIEAAARVFAPGVSDGSRRELESARRISHAMLTAAAPALVAANQPKPDDDLRAVMAAALTQSDFHIGSANGKRLLTAVAAFVAAQTTAARADERERLVRVDGETYEEQDTDEPDTAPPVIGLTITVHGEPAPQGSKRHVGGGRMIESSAKVKPWREAVKHAAIAEADFRYPDGHAALDGPLSVEVVFTVRKPASAPKRRVTWPAKKPDLDKLVRSTFDALTDAGVWRDDAQVVELAATKVYPDEGLYALQHPGAVIRITPIGGA